MINTNLSIFGLFRQKCQICVLYSLVLLIIKRLKSRILMQVQGYLKGFILLYICGSLKPETYILDNSGTLKQKCNYVTSSRLPKRDLFCTMLHICGMLVTKTCTYHLQHQQEIKSTRIVGKNQTSSLMCYHNSSSAFLAKYAM